MRDLSDGSVRRAAPAVVPVLLAVALAGCSASHGSSNSTSAGSSANSSQATESSAPSQSSSAPGKSSATPTVGKATATGKATGSSAAKASPAPVESNPPGDIPDSIAYVPYTNSPGRYHFVHPEGWASAEHGATVTFTDKLNGITATPMSGRSAPTVASARAADLPKLSAGQPAFQLESVKPVSLPGGSGVLIVYRRNSAPDQVTGRTYRDEVQRYEIYSHGHGITLELFGAVGSDNVDPYTKISQSLGLA